jgi:hypothetical protein
MGDDKHVSIADVAEALGMLRTDSASLSPEGHVTDSASLR